MCETDGLLFLTIKHDILRLRKYHSALVNVCLNYVILLCHYAETLLTSNSMFGVYLHNVCNNSLSSFIRNHTYPV